MLGHVIIWFNRGVSDHLVKRSLQHFLAGGDDCLSADLLASITPEEFRTLAGFNMPDDRVRVHKSLEGASFYSQKFHKIDDYWYPIPNARKMAASVVWCDFSLTRKDAVANKLLSLCFEVGMTPEFPYFYKFACYYWKTNKIADKYNIELPGPKTFQEAYSGLEPYDYCQFHGNGYDFIGRGSGRRRLPRCHNSLYKDSQQYFVLSRDVSQKRQKTTTTKSQSGGHNTENQDSTADPSCKNSQSKTSSKEKSTPKHWSRQQARIRFYYRWRKLRR